MRTLPTIFLFSLISYVTLNAQVKIGDDPQTIDSFSLLELESGSRALVITRVNGAQMANMSPLRGAMVYNTDQSCVFYYNGSDWNNLCEGITNIALELNGDDLVLTDSAGNNVSVTLTGALGQTFTTDPVVNFTESVVITQNGNNFNFEVKTIPGSIIAEKTINGIALQDNAITARTMGENSVGQSALQDNSVADLEIDYDQVTLSDFTNDVGYITSAQLINIGIDGTELVFTQDDGTETRIDPTIFSNPGSNDQNLEDVLRQGNSAGNTKIIDLAQPTLDNDAATKAYVDNAIAGTRGANELMEIANDSIIIQDGNGRVGMPWENINTNMANTILTLDGDRVHNLNGKSLVFGGSGTVGIGIFDSDTGTPAPALSTGNKLHVAGTIRAEGIRNTFGTLPGSVAYSFNNDSDTGTYRAGVNTLGLVTGGTEAIRINADGDMGIGLDFTDPTTTIDAKLHVVGDAIIDGTIYTDQTTAPIPDFVFQNYFTGRSPIKENYIFKTLEEVERFIRQHHHLPGVTSAAQAQKEGFWDLGRSNLQNLEKIEELFLHVIEQGKQIKSLKAKNNKLTEEIGSLKKDMELIKQMLSQKDKK